jgi:hypothetical protein
VFLFKKNDIFCLKNKKTLSLYHKNLNNGIKRTSNRLHKDALARINGNRYKTSLLQTLASEHCVLIAENGFLVEVFPDGTKKTIKEIGKPQPLSLGKSFTI